jgi:alanyl-tRNA synthetase
VVVDATPFYGEGGGQVGDAGALRASGAAFSVTDARKPVPGLIVHHGALAGGRLAVGDRVALSVTGPRRDATRRNHTATHLLHAALRQVLGEHVQQKGSLVAPDRLRFDFSHHKAMTDAEVTRVEDLVNEAILRNAAVSAEVMGIDAAKARGAMSLFGEKYGDEVRVITVGDDSMELCGGTHVSRAGDIGLFRFLGESGVSAGVRRVEAVTGLGALARVRQQEGALNGAAAELRCPPDELAESIRKLQAEARALRKELDDARRAAALSEADGLLARAVPVRGFKVLAAEVTDPEGLRDQADKLRDQLGSGVVVLGNRAGGKATLLVAVTKDLAGKGVHAGDLVRGLAAIVGGKGGGRPDFAQAGGPDVAALYDALAAVPGLVGGA